MPLPFGHAKIFLIGANDCVSLGDEKTIVVVDFLRVTISSAEAVNVIILHIIVASRIDVLSDLDFIGSFSWFAKLAVSRSPQIG
jgi:hypothetical protein